MKHTFLLLLLSGIALLLRFQVHAQHEDIPYQPVANICETCVCLSTQDSSNRIHQTLNCAMKNFEHILARWPTEFGTQSTGVELVASYSGNRIRLLQQLPATNATLTLSCRHCGMQQLQAPLFMDVPNVQGLYLSWNEISDEALKPDLFRGPFKATKYEPIALKDLDLSHNRIARLDRKLFEHTPQLTKLALAYNRLNVLDAATTASIAAVTTLQRLDLSHNEMTTLPTELFGTLSNLRFLDVSGNMFAQVPSGIQLLGKSLIQLNLADNAFVVFNSQNFPKLESLRRLNISDNRSLRVIDRGSLRLPALEQLDCSHNPKLERIELNDLVESRNLTQLDLSQNALNTLTLNASSSNVTWSRLRSFAIAGNPWFCNCDLFQALDLADRPHIQQSSDVARCDTPYILAGAQLSNLTADFICNLIIPKNYRAVDEEPPRFLRRRYIILTAIIASVVVVLGLIIGFIVVCVRRRLKGSDYGVQPIRYTSVRGSNLSAFSQLQPASVTSKFQNPSSAAVTGAANA
ncbi:leucine-rich alpha-2-glycoprotein [Drosophila tropicalis]|uniref:leucine-rich alpha-2-glycoprotein n=1 Tax=Drosophila tropicalis TaxID=46794 RepID=UPI0035AC03CA